MELTLRHVGQRMVRCKVREASIQDKASSTSASPSGPEASSEGRLWSQDAL